MRKGALDKKLGYYSIYKNDKYEGDMRGWIWDRYSFGKAGNISVHAYLNAHNLKTYSVYVEGELAGQTYRRTYAIKHGFKSIKEAFEWGESQVDYKNNKIKDMWG